MREQGLVSGYVASAGQQFAMKKDEAHPLTGNFENQTYGVGRRDPPRFDRGWTLHRRLLIRGLSGRKFVSGAATDVLVQV